MKQPLKVLSTSLGVMLVGHMLLTPAAGAAEAADAGPQLVEWSNEDVKVYFDPIVDWSLPDIQAAAAATPEPTQTPQPGSGTASSASGSTVVVNNHYGGYGGSFGWDDLLLYHLIANAVTPYSSTRWVADHRTYYYKTNQSYVPKTYNNTTFANRSTTKTPTTSSGTGAFTTKKSKSASAAKTTTGSAANTSKTTSAGSGSSSGSSKTSSSSSSMSGSKASSSSSKSSSAKSGSIGGKSSGFSSSSGS